jgi:transposase InsO family protein
MKNRYKNSSIEYWCGMFGMTRQAWYKVNTVRKARVNREVLILEKVRLIREDQPKIGTARLCLSINKNSGETGLKIGRDSLHKVMQKHDMLVRQRRSFKPKMTDGDGNSIFPDLRIGFVPEAANQLWSTDITYIELKGAKKHCYATFIIDEYSHLIVGYVVSERMLTQDVIGALRCAIKEQKIKKELTTLIHHSDRGSQFKSAIYQKLLSDFGIKPSMTKNGSPYENPVSERLNGIIKNELMIINLFDSFEHAKACIDKAVEVYNNQRLHSSCDYLTPQQAHQQQGHLQNRWKRKDLKVQTG